MVLQCLLSKTDDSYTLYISGVDINYKNSALSDMMFLYIINYIIRA